MKYYLIAGEASGDLHGSKLMHGLQLADPAAEFRFWGGDQMQAVGGHPVRHIRDLAFMGFWEVAVNLRTILGNIAFCKADILEYQPDALILIDYPGFNLRIAEWAKEQGIRVFYYISPQLWAWKAGRVKIIQKAVERLFVILPFEEAFYQQYDLAVDFVGHPLLDVIDPKAADPGFLSTNNLSQQRIIALLPGSRKQEISRMLGIMLEVIPHFPDYQFVVGGAPSMDRSFYQAILEQAPAPVQAKVHLVENQTYALLQHAKAALVTSGTATLETALFQVPQVVCYRGSKLSYLIARQLVQVKYISLVNLILDREVVTECIQQDCTPKRLTKELQKILSPAGSQEMQQAYQELRSKLGTPGVGRRTAHHIVARLQTKGATTA